MKVMQKGFVVLLCCGLHSYNLIAQSTSISTTDDAHYAAIAATLENGISSKNAEEREKAFELLLQHAPIVPAEIIGKFVMAGLEDSSEKVKMAAVEVISSNARRIANVSTASTLEDILDRAVTARGINAKSIKNVAGVISGLALLKFHRLPFGVYCEWEDEYLVPLINTLQENVDVASRCAAISLCGVLQCPGNTSILVKILRASLMDKREDIQFAGIAVIQSFLSTEIVAFKLVAYAALRPIVEKVSREGSLKVKQVALYSMPQLDTKLLEMEAGVGVTIAAKSSGSPASDVGAYEGTQAPK